MTSEESKGHRWSLMSDPIIGFAIFFFFFNSKTPQPNKCRSERKDLWNKVGHSSGRNKITLMTKLLVWPQIHDPDLGE